MHAKRHALLARLLIEACGGLEAAGDACRLKTSQLQRFTDKSSGQFMPADVIADLEATCGRQIYSRALCDARPDASGAEDLVNAASDLTEVSAVLQKTARLAAADGQIDAVELQAIDRLVELVGQELGDVRAAADRGRS